MKDLFTRFSRRARKGKLKSVKVGHSGNGVPGPDAVTVSAKHLKVGEGWVCTVAVTGYPAEVGAGFLEPVLSYPGRLDTAIHIAPIPPQIAAEMLRKQRGRLESSRRADASKGRVDNPEVDAAASDAADLAGRLARGEAKLFQAAIYLSVWAGDEDELDERVGEVRTIAASLLLGTQPMTFRQVQAWIATLPVGVDGVGITRTLDTLALAAMFPFTSPDVPPPTDRDVLYGPNASGPGIVTWDRWSQPNYNTVILGQSGAGKSYLGKLDLVRNLYRGIEACVVDPDDEYIALAEALGGVVIRPGTPEVRINPFDLRPDDPEAVTTRAGFIHTLVEVLAGTISPAERNPLDEAILAAYHRKGINFDPRTWRRTPPLLADLVAELKAHPDPAGPHLAARLGPYASGSFSKMFSGHSTHRPDGHLVVYAIKDVPDEMRTIATLLVLDAISARINIKGRTTPMIVHIDEAWKLLNDGAGARFLLNLAKSARKLLVGLTVLTQDAIDVLQTDAGQKVVSNCATQILLKQASQAISVVSGAFALTDGERTFVTTAPLGYALLLGGTTRVGFMALADPDHEHPLVITATAR